MIRPLIVVLAAGLPASICLGQGATQLWETNCANCHGDRAQGGGAGTASLLDDKYLGVDRMKFDRQFFDAIKNGIKSDDGSSAGMAAFGETLKDDQIWSLVVHIRELQDRDRRKREGVGVLKKPAEGVYTTQHARYRIETIVSKEVETPWGLDWLPPSEKGGKTTVRMLITERPGDMRVYEYATDSAAAGKLSAPITGMPKVNASGQGGLMDVTVHPDYAKNGWIYLSYSNPKDRNSMTIFVRGKLKQEGDAYQWTEQETLWEPKPEHYLSGGLHFGSRIVFTNPIETGPDKGKRYMFFCLGERGRGEMSQDLKRPNGKTFRLFDDGTVPSDNPFLKNADAYPAMYSYGHRNPQGMVIDLNGNVWVTEHGPRGGDELNLVKPGANYGWPVVSYGINYSDAPLKTPWPSESQKFEMPVWVWLPSTAVCGLDVARPGPLGEAFPKWKGDLFAGGLAGATIDRLRIKDGQVVEREEVVGRMGRVRDVAFGPEGALYVALNGPDRIIRLVPQR